MINEALPLILLFFGFVVLHILFLRVVGNSNFIRNGGVLLLVFLAVPVLSWGGKLVFLSLWNMYMFALICSQNSVSLRILDEIDQTPGGALADQELLERFSDRESLGVRIALMTKNGFLRSTGTDGVELTAKARFLARSILFARSILGSKSRG